MGASAAVDESAASDPADLATTGQGYYQTGRALVAAGEVGNGLRAVAVATLVAPNPVWPEMYLITVTQQHCFDWDRAVFEGALAVRRNHPALLECVGRLYEGERRYGQAEKLYRQWADSDDELAEPHARLGELYHFQRRDTRALGAFGDYQARTTGTSRYAQRRMAKAAASVARPAYNRIVDDWYKQVRGQGMRGASIWSVHRWQAAAVAGQADAQYNLGMILNHGWGVDADPAQASQWFERAAEQGNHHAALELALLCLTGVGQEVDVEQAFKWAREAADDVPGGMLLLAVFYDHGVGVPRDTAAATQWYYLAGVSYLADDNPLMAHRVRDALAVHHADGRIQQRLTALLNRQRGGGTPAARLEPIGGPPPTWTETSVGEVARSGDPVALFVEGKTALQRAAITGSAQDRDRGLIYLQAAADAGFAAATRTLGTLYLTGDQVPVDSIHGLRLMEQAGNAGDLAAQKQLGEVYFAGTETPRNLPRAAYWYLEALQNPRGSYHGDALWQTEMRLATIYAEGGGGAASEGIDPERALGLWEHAAREGKVPMAQHALARARAGTIRNRADREDVIALFYQAATTYLDTGYRFGKDRDQATEHAREILVDMQQVAPGHRLVSRLDQRLP